ncbi:hypothetical protein WK13_34850 [Burkholderia ubonensis]|nr:hypothetical protein WK13_34850 [Burkholderia ubonensis]
MQISSEIAAPEVDVAITEAIDAAQLRIGTLIDSELQSTDLEDVFYLDSDSFSGVQPAGLYRLRLRSGLVNPGSEQVYWGSDFNRATVPVDPLNVHIDYVKGIVSIPRKKHNECFIRVTYNAGYEPVPEPTPNPTPDPTPSTDPAPDTTTGPDTGDSAVAPGPGEVNATTFVEPFGLSTGGQNAGGSAGYTQDGTATGLNTDPYVRLVGDGGTPLQSIATPTRKPQTADMAPKWLREAVLGYVPAVMSTGLNQSEQSGTIKNYQASGEHALAVASPHTRTALGFCLRPVV